MGTDSKLVDELEHFHYLLFAGDQRAFDGLLLKDNVKGIKLDWHSWQANINDCTTGSQRRCAPFNGWNVVRTDNDGRETAFPNPGFDLVSCFTIIKVDN